MYIQPISVNQPDFGAKLNKNSIRELLNDVKYTRNVLGTLKYKSEQEAYVQIYTLLKRADELPQKVLDMKYNYHNKKCSLLIGDEKICSKKYRKHSANYFKLLKDALVENPLRPIYNDKYVRMPKRIFEQECWNNRNIKMEDIYKLALDE